jgi:hypothetical protein
MLRARAVYDAHLHCAEVACEPAELLVIDFRSAIRVPAGRSGGVDALTARTTGNRGGSAE